LHFDNLRIKYYFRPFLEESCGIPAVISLTFGTPRFSSLGVGTGTPFRAEVKRRNWRWKTMAVGIAGSTRTPTGPACSQCTCGHHDPGSCTCALRTGSASSRRQCDCRSSWHHLRKGRRRCPNYAKQGATKCGPCLARCAQQY